MTSRLAEAGWEIRALGRKPSRQGGSAFSNVHFELGEPVAPQVLAGVNALVHLAYDYDWHRWTDIQRVNVDGTRRLLAAAQEAGIDRIVYVSSIAAFPGAESMYGQAKLACEQAALAAGAAIVRPARVWGEDGTTSLGALQSAAERLPIVPLPVPGKFDLYFTHQDDLAGLVEALLEQWPTGAGKLYVAASGEAIEFRALLRLLVRRTGRNPLLVQLPWRLVRSLMRILEARGIKAPFSSDGILVLAESDPRPLAHATDRTDRYGVSFRSYPLA